jgi:hypothetical protein
MNQQRRFRLITLLFLVMVALIGAGVSLPVEGHPEMAEGKVMSLTLVQGSGPSLVLFPKQ